MRRYVPSEVVAYIDRALSFVSKDNPGGGQSFQVHRELRASLLGLVELAERVPEHLYVDTDALTDVISAVQAIRTVVREAEVQDVRGQAVSGPPDLRPVAPNQWSPVIMIRRAFGRCRDEAPSPQIERLQFVTDPQLRRTLETDLDGVDRALAGGEWKAATVLGGSVVEALLLWAIQEKRTAEVEAGITNLLGTGSLKKNPGTDPEMWHLGEYSTVASELKLIRPETAKQAQLLTGFRNLIHPGRAARTGQACNRGTAHAARAAIAFVIEDLQ